MNACRSAAETMLCWPLGTYDSALRIQCTRQPCQEEPKTRRTAAFSPSCASEMTSFTPRRPRRARLLRKVDQKVSFARTDVQTDDLSLALGVHRHGAYCSNRNDAAALALLEVGG